MMDGEANSIKDGTIEVCFHLILKMLMTAEGLNLSGFLVMCQSLKEYGCLISNWWTVIVYIIV
jgi:hypothetical protein